MEKIAKGEQMRQIQTAPITLELSRNHKELVKVLVDSRVCASAVGD